MAVQKLMPTTCNSQPESNAFWTKLVMVRRSSQALRPLWKPNCIFGRGCSSQQRYLCCLHNDGALYKHLTRSSNARFWVTLISKKERKKTSKAIVREVISSTWRSWLQPACEKKKKKKKKIELPHKDSYVPGITWLAELPPQHLWKTILRPMGDIKGRMRWMWSEMPIFHFTKQSFSWRVERSQYCKPNVSLPSKTPPEAILYVSLVKSLIQEVMVFFCWSSSLGLWRWIGYCSYGDIALSYSGNDWLFFSILVNKVLGQQTPQSKDLGQNYSEF